VRPRPSSTPDGDSHDRIDSNGKLSLRHNSRFHHIRMGRRYAGTPVLVLVTTCTSGSSPAADIYCRT